MRNDRSSPGVNALRGNLIAAGRVPVVHIGRSAKIRADALADFVESLAK